MRKATKSLIIVESPTKIKTLKKFLGSEYSFESSLGHIRDLPAKGFGIDVENDFEPQYTPLEDKKETIAKLQKAAREATIVYLAPDPDREGEAIAWHIASILPPGTKYKRTAFNSITKEAVLTALQHPREIDQALVDAQQARRLLDRIVGYKISPILTRRVQGARDGGLSAGRVQSVALKFVVDREKEIEAFLPVEYWNISTLLQGRDQSFVARLYSIDGKKIEKEQKEGKEVMTLPNERVAGAIVERLRKASYQVERIEKKEKKRHPVPPFITSTLQQEASRHHGFSASRTMGIAQSLYEGVDLGEEGAEGLITYMRTDSVRVVPEAIDAVREYIVQTYGKEYLPDHGRIFTTKKSAQDAHEAIRPTNLSHSPEKVKRFLSKEQYDLYLLIWRRFIASQMTLAIYDTVTCDIAASGIMLRATGSLLRFPGFLAVYEEKIDLIDSTEEEERALLPFLEEGEKLDLLDLYSEQSFTKPPARFTEASLIKELEKSGIGRPSTYATIMNKIHSRDYTLKEKGVLRPTELGRVIARMLEENFGMIMDVHFTAAMEDDLEEIEAGKMQWKELIILFWQKFIQYVETAEKEAHVPKEMTDIDCPLCHTGKLQKIWSKRQYFYGCSKYPDCKYTSSIEAFNFKKEEYNPDFDWEKKCPKCEQEMQLRFGKFGPFLGCVNYPECKGIVNIPKAGEMSQEEMPHCPAIGCTGKITVRRSRFGKIFFSCSEFPQCDVIVNHLEELDEKYKSHKKTACPPRKATKKRSAKPKQTKRSPIKGKKRVKN